MEIILSKHKGLWGVILTCGGIDGVMIFTHKSHDKCVEIAFNILEASLKTEGPWKDVVYETGKQVKAERESN